MTFPFPFSNRRMLVTHSRELIRNIFVTLQPAVEYGTRLLNRVHSLLRIYWHLLLLSNHVQWGMHDLLLRVSHLVL